MSNTAEQVLVADALTQVLLGIKTGIETKLPSQFLTPTFTADGDRSEYFRVNATRQVARNIMRNAKARGGVPAGATRQPVMLSNFKERRTIDSSLIDLLKSDNPNRQRLAEQMLARQLRNDRLLLDNARVAMAHSALVLGTISFDADGYLQNSTSGAAFSVDFGVPAGNQDQAQMDGSTTIINASWATAGTDIPKQVRLLKQTMMRLYGYDLQWAFYGENILSYLLTNTLCAKLISANPSLQNAFAGNEIPDGFLGLKWRPLTGSYFADAAGDVSAIGGGDTLVMTPDPADDWWQFHEGTTNVPRDLNVQNNAMAVLDSIDKIAGMYEYAQGQTDPVGIDRYYGDCCLPIIANGNAILQLDVTP